MFTGIIEEVGSVARVETRPAGIRLEIACRVVLEDAFEGASIAVNGLCLTAVNLTARGFSADVSPESLRRSTLESLPVGSPVNLERPLSPSGRLGGHIVQGHVDATGEVISLELVGEGNWWLRVRYPDSIDRYLVEKGSVAIDGISLTIAAVEERTFAVTIIPHTYQSTIVRTYRAGAKVNLECDVLAKYVEKMLGPLRQASKGLTLDRLREMGY
ncbi:MAG: riboflavin synthase [Bryobacterales bacterium]|nr:riboflavin synthase [Bryobacterales bacterium]